MRRNSRIPAAYLAVAVAGVAAVAVLAPSAQASYFQAPQSNGVCQGVDNLHGIGASGLRGAKVAWGNTLGQPTPAAPLAQGFGYDAGADYAACAVFKTAADLGTKVFDYRATGSGSCLTILGATAPNLPRQYTDATGTTTDVAYCGTEDAPTEAQIANAEEGPATAPTHPSEAQLLTVPVAQVAVAIATRLPDGCQVDQAKRSISRDDAEAAFAGTITTWNDIFGTDMTRSAGSPLTDQQCRDKVFKRVVRKDKSGTTFLLKRYLQGVSELPGGSSVDWREPSFGGTLENDAWPNDPTPNPVLRGDANGNGSLLDKLSLQTVDGGIGYADLSTARSKDYGWTYSGTYAVDDRKVWMRVQRIPNDTYNSPGVSNAQATSGDNLASACVGVTYSNQPTTDLGESWALASAVPTPTDYSICGLNYVVTSLWGFDTGGGRNKPVWAGSANAGEWRANRDYLRYLLGVIRPGVGPSKLPPAGYAKLPSDVKATAICTANKVGYLRSSTDPAPAAVVPRGTCP